MLVSHASSPLHSLVCVLMQSITSSRLVRGSGGEGDDGITCPSHLLALCSRTPRWSNSLLAQDRDRPIYTVPFMGGNGRVRNPSRKNTALDIVGGGRLGDEWASNGTGRGGQPQMEAPLLGGAAGIIPVPAMQVNGLLARRGETGLLCVVNIA